RTQAQLVQSTKLAAIGELAANIAHEINNPLTTVLGFASFLAERIAPTDPMREELGLIQEEASRARDIVRDLLQFSRQRDFSPESADVNTVLEQVIAMVRRQGALNVITVDERYEPDLPAVELDVSRIKQVFLNIINNAVYVMPNGGSLTVRTETANGGGERHGGGARGRGGAHQQTEGRRRGGGGAPGPGPPAGGGGGGGDAPGPPHVYRLAATRAAPRSAVFGFSVTKTGMVSI